MYLRRTIKITASVLVLMHFLSCKGNNDQYFEVEGQLKNAESEMVYLQELSVGGNQRIIVDSSTVSKNGNFNLKAESTEENAYAIYFGSDFAPVVINDDDKVKIHIDMKNQKELYTVNGSAASESLKTFLYRTGDKLQKLYKYNFQIDSLRRALNDSGATELQQNASIVANDLKADLTETIQQSKSPALSMFVLGYYQSLTADPRFQLVPLQKSETARLVNSIREKYPDHTGVATVAVKMNEVKKAPDFTFPDVEGKPLSLSSFRGKYVLIDFWASWCMPCRRENPNIVNAYNKYNSKNFTILGVSLDATKEAWVKAIQDDGLTWPQVSDLQEWNSAAVKLYGFNSIPYNVLLDPEGNIIAENLRGAGLETKLAEVLK